MKVLSGLQALIVHDRGARQHCRRRRSVVGPAPATACCPTPRLSGGILGSVERVCPLVLAQTLIQGRFKPAAPDRTPFARVKVRPTTSQTSYTRPRQLALAHAPGFVVARAACRYGQRGGAAGGFKPPAEAAGDGGAAQRACKVIAAGGSAGRAAAGVRTPAIRIPLDRLPPWAALRPEKGR